MNNFLKIENEIKDLVLGKKDAKELVYAFQKEDVEVAQKKLGLEKGKYILFSDKSSTPIKRKDVAEKS